MSKISKLMESLKDNTHAGIITSEPNRLYFLDFHSSAGTLIVTKEQAYFIIDFRYVEMARKQITDAQIILQNDLDKQIKEIISKHNIKEVSVENTYMTINGYEEIKKQCAPANVTLDADFDKAILRMRSIKDAEEIRRIRAAQELTDQTFAYILPRITKGRTERDIALDMEFFIRKNGSEGVAFDFIVLSGKNGSTPHGVPGDTKVKNGDFITMDFGAVVDGYRSDMTRTVAVGEVSDAMKYAYDTVLKAQLESIKAIMPGKSCRDIDKISRDIIYGAGFEGKYGHGLGHSVGVEIHEDPSFSPKSDSITEAGLIMTIEPGVYIEGEFGLRIEDMGLVTDSGIDIFTKSAKELIIL